MDIQKLKTTHIYNGKVFNVLADVIRLPNGNEVTLDIVAHNGAVVILPVDDDGNIWFIHQYRHAAGRVMLELPAGTLEEGETPENSVHREIREEIGMAANKITKIGEFYIAPGYSTEYLHVYLATGLCLNPLPGDVDEIITIEKIPILKAYEIAAVGDIIDAKTLAALFLAEKYIRRT